MNWALLLKPLDRRVILSAPVLAIVVILIVVVAGRLDYAIKMAGSRSILIAISSERDDALEETSNVTLPAGLEQEITALAHSSDVKLITVDSLHALPDYHVATHPRLYLIIALSAS